MALFRISKGNEKNLPAQKREGFAYFTIDESDFYIDTESSTINAQGNPEGGVRQQLNAHRARYLKSKDVNQDKEHDLYIDDEEISLGRKAKESNYEDPYSGTAIGKAGFRSIAVGSAASATGNYSSSFGTNTSAQGVSSHAEGKGTVADGEAAHAEGVDSQSLAYGAHAEGIGTAANGEGSHAEGYSSSTDINAKYAHAEGKSTQANGNYAHAEGDRSVASGESSHAEGSQTKATGIYAHAEGLNTQATAQAAHAEGQLTVASQVQAHAEGFKTVASGAESHAEGEETKALGHVAHAEGSFSEAIGDWTHAEGFTSKAEADYSHAEGVETLAQGSGSHTEGYKTTTTKAYAHAEGQSTQAKGQGSHAEGNTTTAQGDYSHAEGQSTSATGGMSHAEGSSTTSSGVATHAEGSSTTASGNSAHAEGKSGQATGSYSHVEGFDTRATNESAHAEGNKSQATGKYSHAQGNQTLASGESANAEGQTTSAIGVASHAEGLSSQSQGNYSHSEGNATKATKEAAHSEGTSTQADGNSSHAEGKSTVASGDYSHSEGQSTTASGEQAHAEGKGGQATGAGAHVEGYWGVAGGIAAHAEGNSTKANGKGSHAEGYGTSASGSYSHAEGSNLHTDESELAAVSIKDSAGTTHTISTTTAAGLSSHAEGVQTLAKSYASHAEGFKNIAINNYAHAEGTGVKAEGAASHAEGNTTTASGAAAHAEGSITTASGASAHAEGQNTVASGNYSHAEGYKATASGADAHAEGNTTVAGGADSHAQNLGTIANGDAQTAIGKYNIADTTSAFIVGKGTSSSARSNAFTIDWNGNTFVAGKITQGTPSADTTITSMNRFQSDLFVSGDGSAPNQPKVAGFYLGKSTSDENRHMDIVSGGDYSYIDFNKASVVEDYKTRLIVNVTTGNTQLVWGASATDKLFAIAGNVLVTENFTINGTLTVKKLLTALEGIYSNRGATAKASFWWNKAGTNWGGIGYNGTSNENYLGPCDDTGAWKNAETDSWKIQGKVTITNDTTISGASTLNGLVTANSGILSKAQIQIIGGTVNGKSIYQFDNATYRNPDQHTPEMLIRSDNSSTGVLGYRPGLVIYNEQGNQNATAGLTFAFRETASAGNAVMGAAILSIKESAGTNNAWSQAGLRFLTKNFGNVVEAMAITNDGKVGIATTTPSYKLHVVGDIYANGGWFRVSGNQGYYFESHGGGWYMTDANYVRSYNNKKVIAGNSIYIGTTSGDGKGLSLYSESDPTTYGIHMSTTSTYSRHGDVQSDWATYFNMNDVGQRGWIYRAGSTNVASISANGVGSFSAVGNNSRYIAFPRGGEISTNGSSGYLIIQLPVFKTATMLKFKVSIYNYNTNETCDYIISGYNYTDGNWYNPTAICLGKAGAAHSNLTVRFGHFNGYNAISIGESGTTWQYPNVTISDVTLGHDFVYSDWCKPWTLSFTTTALTNITQTITDTHMGRVSGTINKVAKFTAVNTVGDSNITDDGSTVTIGTKVVVQGNGSSYNEGIRILPASNGWSNIFFSANSSVSGEHDGGWLIGRRGAVGSTAGGIGDFTIEEQNSSGVGLTIHKDNGGMTLRNGTFKILGTETNDGSGQLAIFKALSTKVSTAGGWVGRSLMGAKDLTFLLGTYNGMAAIGAHSWSDSAAGTGAAWAPMYFQPDGGASAAIYMGQNGGGWTKNTGTVEIKGSGTAQAGTVAINGTTTMTSPVANSNNAHTGVLAVNNTISDPGNTYFSSISMFAPNVVAGRNHLFMFGKARSSKDSAYLGFNWSATGSSNNFITLGLYAVDNVLNITGAGNVGIGTTAPGYKLHVNGTGRFENRLYLAEWIQFDGATGLYFPGTNCNGLHIMPNQVGSYAPVRIVGSRGGYGGIHFGDNNQGLTVMSSEPHQGLYNESTGRWILYYHRSNNLISIGNSTVRSGFINMGGSVYTEGNIHINNGGHGGIGLYNTSSPNTYGIHMSTTGSYGTFGGVSGDWATYFCFDGAVNRGWIFKHAGTNVASINGLGQAWLKGITTCNRGTSTAATNYGDSAIEIREYGFGGAQSDTWGVAPRLSFHWAGRVAAQIGLASSGWLYAAPNSHSGTAMSRIVLEDGGTWGINVTGSAAALTTSAGSAGQAIYFASGKPVALDWRMGNSSTGEHNCNNVTYNFCGYYNSNGPSTSIGATTTDGSLWAQAYNSTWVTQIAQDYRDGDLFVRGKNNGSWTAWKRMWATGDAVTSAVWNDYAECREADTVEAGYVLTETGRDNLIKTTQRLQHFAGISSDTWGFSQGETEKAKTPIAVAGRVLAYPYRDRNEYQPGDCVCAAPGGTVDIMTREEIIQWPDRIVGTVSSVPEYETWGGGEGADRDPVKVNGRIWIKVK